MNESHDCTRFESSLLDLVYAEIPEAEAEELRHHAAKCQKCRTALEETMLTRKLAAQLPLLEPNSEIDATILAAAEKRATELAGLGDAEGEKNRGAHGDMWLKHPTFGERLRSFLLAPALATTAIACLVLVFSLFLSNQHHPVDKTQEPAGAPIDEAPLLATRETVPHSENEIVAENAFSSPPPAEPRARAPLRRRSAKNPPPSLKSSDGAITKLGTRGPAPAGAFSSSPSKSSQTGRSRGAQNEKDEYVQRFKKSAPAAGAPEMGSQERQLSPSRDSGEDAVFERGMNAYSRGDCTQAIADLKYVVESSSTQSKLVPRALLHIARCEKRRGRCGAAIPAYEKLLSQFPNFSGKETALFEAAVCHRRLGHVDRARTLLQDLSRSPGWETRSQQELQRLDTEQNK